eukprot:TRINITY_DN60277_c0_g1_i2.p2 TRINITY_DN60277_c0_g1~~TRINITY_DN60277_c0_g1_i2.p2  ORF type:complete len:122 (+),score=41.27 TRINITY_DN60277_c0_g1_i2:239-604(+)
MAQLIPSLPKALGKLLQAGGWAWVGYATVRLTQALIPEHEPTPEEKAKSLFARMDTNKDDPLTAEEFKAYAAKEGGNFQKAVENGFFEGLLNKAGSAGIVEEDFVKAWLQIQEDANAFKSF